MYPVGIVVVAALTVVGVIMLALVVRVVVKAHLCQERCCGCGCRCGRVCDCRRDRGVVARLMGQYS